MSVRIKLIFVYFITLVISVATITILSFLTTVNFFETFNQQVFNNKEIEEVFEIGSRIMADIVYTIENDVDKMLDETFLDDVSGRLSPFNVLIGVEKDGEMVYFSSSEYKEELIDYIQTIDFNEEPTHNRDEKIDHYISFEGSSHYVIKHTFEFDNPNDGALYTVMDISNIEYTARDYIRDLMKIFFTVVLIAIIVFLLVIMKMIIKPLKKLEEGTMKIKEGNLDFTLESKSKDEFGRVCNSFEKMRIELKSSIEKQVQYEENRKELISNISHDLKTPITAIKGYSQGILDGVANTEEKMNRYLHVIHSKSVDMDRLIDQLFLFSKLDLNKLSFDMKQIKAKDYFEQFVEDIKVELLVQNIELNYKNNVNDETLMTCDEQNLRRVLVNIVQNSVKYMDKEAKYLDINIDENDTDIKVCIKDNGIGIKSDEINYIFDKFYRCDKARNTEIPGSGIGLSITKQIIERHEGKIWAESEYGEFTKVCFTIKKLSEREGL